MATVTAIQHLERGLQAQAGVAGGRVRLTRDEVMTAPEVADLLHLPVSTDRPDQRGEPAGVLTQATADLQCPSSGTTQSGSHASTIPPGRTTRTI